MTILLINKIISLFIIMFAGALLVRCKVLKAADSRTLSATLLYLLTPCMILSAFQVECTPEVQGGLALAAGASAIIHVVIIVLNIFARKALKLDALEQASMLYSNAGNLIIPLVGAMLGDEWVIYTSGYIAMQLVLVWSHAKSLLCGDKGLDLKKIFTNFNMISIIIGMFLFFTGIRFPKPVADAISSMGGMVGPASMLVAGMLIGGMDLKKLFSYKRLPLVAALRLVVVPLLALAILRFTGIASLLANGRDVLLVTFLATITPSASTITNMAVVYGLDADYASAINATTTLLCILTMPLMVALYTM